MSDNLKHSVATVAAGLIAFAAVFAGHQLTAPLVGQSSGASHGEGAEPGGEPDGSDTADDGELEPVETPLEYAILGRWQASEPANQDAFVEFTEYGLWFASDGCNNASGTWRIDEDGGFSSEDGGVMTLIGCDNVAIPSAVWSAESVRLEEGSLTLIDGEGTPFELEQARVGGVSLAGRWTAEDPASSGTSFVELDVDGAWEGSDGCNSASGTWEAHANEAFAEGVIASDVPDTAPLPGALSAVLASGMTEMACENLDTVNLPMRLAAANGFTFASADAITLVDSSSGSDPEQWEYLTLARTPAD